MSEYLYRVVYRPESRAWWDGSTEWRVHTSGKGTSVYTGLSAARGAITHFIRRERRYQIKNEYRVQRVPLNAWEWVSDE